MTKEEFMNKWAMKKLELQAKVTNQDFVAPQIKIINEMMKDVVNVNEDLKQKIRQAESLKEVYEAVSK